jgi:hypothetical protein
MTSLGLDHGGTSALGHESLRMTCQKSRRELAKERREATKGIHSSNSITYRIFESDGVEGYIDKPLFRFTPSLSWI